AAVEVFSRLSMFYETRAKFELTPYFAGSRTSSGTSAEQALQYSYRQLELEPWREEAHRQVMRLLALSGQRSAALAQYESCRQTMFEELGVEPESETTELYERIKAGDWGPGSGDQASLSSTRPTNSNLQAPPPTHNLPAQVT